MLVADPDGLRAERHGLGDIQRLRIQAPVGAVGERVGDGGALGRAGQGDGGALGEHAIFVLDRHGRRHRLDAVGRPELLDEFGLRDQPPVCRLFLPRLVGLP